jgi:hypothetical protein
VLDIKEKAGEGRRDSHGMFRGRAKVALAGAKVVPVKKNATHRIKKMAVGIY